jgi:hypothetical protein
MPSKPLRFTDHAEEMLVERMIDRAWVQETIAMPDELNLMLSVPA